MIEVADVVAEGEGEGEVYVPAGAEDGARR